MSDNPFQMLSTKVDGTLDSMKVAHGFIENLQTLSHELCGVRQKLEEENSTCPCVSDALYELGDATEALRHIIVTYARLIDQISQRIIDHDDERELAATAVERAKEVIEAVFAQRERSNEEEPELN